MAAARASPKPSPKPRVTFEKPWSECVLGDCVELAHPASREEGVGSRKKGVGPSTPGVEGYPSSQISVLALGQPSGTRALAVRLRTVGSA